VIGVPVPVAVGTFSAIVVLIVTTKPLLAAARRAVPGLRDRSGELADLAAVRVTNQPAALARLLLSVATNRRQAASPWPVASLWFDADVVRPTQGRMRRVVPSRLDPRDPTDPRAARLAAEGARRALVARARVLVDQVPGDPSLRGALDDAARAVG